MGRRLLLTFLFCALAVDMMCVVPPSWTRKHHAGTIRSASIRDTLGISSDATSVVVWRVANGDTIAAFSSMRGEFQQAWLSHDLESVIAVTHSGYSLWIYWVSISSGSITDSLEVPLPSVGATYANGFVATSDMSGEGTRMVVSIPYVILPAKFPPVYYKPYVVDVIRHTLDVNIPSSMTAERRFESKDTRITGYYRSGVPTPTWSPSGFYAYDGSNLVDYPSTGGSVRLTDDTWYTIRWGHTDAVLLGQQRTPEKDRGVVALIDLCTGSIIDTVADKAYNSFRFWATHDMRQVVAYLGGEIVCWKLPDQSAHDSLCVRTSLPDTVIADSVYEVSSVWFPFQKSQMDLLEGGTEITPTLTSFYSWRDARNDGVRFGRVVGADTSWSPRTNLIAIEKQIPSNAYRVLWTGLGSISSMNTSRNNQILISTFDGKTLIVDNNLHCTRGFRGAKNQYGSVWYSADTVLRVHRWDTSYVDGKSWVNKMKAVVQKFSVRDFRFVAERSFDARVSHTSGTARSYFGLFDLQRQDDLWLAATYTATFGNVGLAFAVDPADISFTPKASTWRYSNPAHILKYGVPIGGAINSTGNFALVLQRNEVFDYGSHGRLVGVDLIGDTAIGAIEEQFGNHAMFITDYIAVVDSMILHVPFMSVNAKHRFKGPFARSIPEGRVIVWDTGYFYHMALDGTLVDSVPGPYSRPTVIRALSSGTIISGHQDGSIQMFGGKGLSADDDSHNHWTARHHNASDLTVTVSPQPAQSSLTIRSTLAHTSFDVTFMLVDLQGAVVYEWRTLSAPSYQFDVAEHGIATGAYVLTMRAGSAIASTLISIIN